MSKRERRFYRIRQAENARKMKAHADTWNAVVVFAGALALAITRLLHRFM